jgi:hypothetical protein
VLDELACGDVGESRVAMLEGADIELVDGSDELLLEKHRHECTLARAEAIICDHG